MIIDTSALVAITLGEAEWKSLRWAIVSSKSAVPAPVLTEFQLATSSRDPQIAAKARELIQTLIADGIEILAFERRHADITAVARETYGRGNGRGGKLNFGDLLVYAIAKHSGLPLLCTGNDFSTTDLVLHPASRLDP